MIFEEVRAIIAEQLGKDESDIALETRFQEDLDADSLDLFQIINDIEDKYDIRIEDTEGLISVGDAVKHVEALLSK